MTEVTIFNFYSQ